MPDRQLPVDDPEIEALAHIAGIMETLDDDARERVLAWCVSKYANPRPRRAPSAASGVAGAAGDRLLRSDPR